jgi:hypothetical protein
MHGSPLLGACCPTVLIGGKPAWRIGDQHTCPIPNAPPPACSGTPHGPGVTTPVPIQGIINGRFLMIIYGRFLGKNRLGAVTHYMIIYGGAIRAWRTSTACGLRP